MGGRWVVDGGRWRSMGGQLYNFTENFKKYRKIMKNLFFFIFLYEILKKTKKNLKKHTIHENT